MGRPPGSKNRVSAEVRDDLLAAYEALGGAAWLEDLGRENPELFTRLLLRVLPAPIDAEVGGEPLIVRFEVPEPPGDRSSRS